MQQTHPQHHNKQPARLRAQKGWFSYLLEVVIDPTQRGILYRDNQPVEWFGPGRHKRSSRRDDLGLELLRVDRAYTPYSPELEQVIPEQAATLVDIKPSQLAVVTVDGHPTCCLEPGRYFLWQLRARVEAIVFDMEEFEAKMSEPFVKQIPRKMLSSHLIEDHQLGLVYVDGVLESYLEPGKHHLWARDRHIRVELLDFKSYVLEAREEYERVLPASMYEKLEVEQGQLAVLCVANVPVRTLEPGRYLVFQKPEPIKAQIFDTTQVHTKIPEVYWTALPHHILMEETIHPYEKGLLYVDGVLENVLGEGHYGLCALHRKVELRKVDLREQEFQINGQEIMTSDKVTIRISLITKFRITDALLSVESQLDLHSALYTETQLAARRIIASSKLEELLEERDRARQSMIEQLTPRAHAWGVEILQVDVKDVILPGEMKTLLNRVIEAEKQAEANIILRREETAATRSQANTAKMMANNKALMRLKELETLRDIASTIDNLTVVVRGHEVMESLKLSDTVTTTATTIDADV